MNIVKRIVLDDLIPKFYGVAWVEDYRNVRVCMPVPLNVLAGFVRYLYLVAAFELPHAIDAAVLRFSRRRYLKYAAILAVDRSDVIDAEELALRWLDAQETDPWRPRDYFDAETVIRALLREVTPGQVAVARAEYLATALRQTRKELQGMLGESGPVKG